MIQRQNKSAFKIAKGLYIQKRISGIPRVCFPICNANKILIKTHAIKKPNIYLYDTEDDKILWVKKSKFLTSSYVPDSSKIFCFNDQIAITDSSGVRGSCIKYYEVLTGNFIGEFLANNMWTDLLIFRDGMLAGCRDGYLYFIDKQAKLKYKFCVKDPNENYPNPYGIPSPFCVTFDKEQNYVAFNYYTTLYLLNSKLEFIWKKDIGVDTGDNKKGLIELEFDLQNRTAKVDYSIDIECITKIEFLENESFRPHIKVIFNNKKMKNFDIDGLEINQVKKTSGDIMLN